MISKRAFWNKYEIRRITLITFMRFFLDSVFNSTSNGGIDPKIFIKLGYFVQLAIYPPKQVHYYMKREVSGIILGMFETGEIVQSYENSRQVPFCVWYFHQTAWRESVTTLSDNR